MINKSDEDWESFLGYDEGIENQWEWISHMNEYLKLHGSLQALKIKNKQTKLFF